jgi:methionyl-tRNA formyltransferase
MSSSLTPFVYAANNRNGFLCGHAIAEAGFLPELLLLHPSKKQKFGEEIRSLFPEVPVLEWSRESILRKLEAVTADILLSVNFGYIFPSDILSLFRSPINLHTGHLPFNQGSHPNVWSIVENTPAGVTLHIMTPDVDNGDIIAQKEVPVSAVDTGKTLYAKLEEASVALVKDVFPSLLKGEIRTTPMPEGGTFHFAREFDDLCALSLEETVSTEAFLRRLRALSFPPYKNAYFMDNGKRVYVDITMTPEPER